MKMPNLIKWRMNLEDRKEQKRRSRQRNDLESTDRKNRKDTFWAITLSSLIGLGAFMYIDGCKDDIGSIYNNWQNQENKTEVADTSEKSNQNKPSDTIIKEDDTKKSDSTYKSDKDQKTDTVKTNSKKVNQLEERVSDLEEGLSSVKEDVKENTINYNNLSDKVENIRDDLEDLDNQVDSIHSYHIKQNEEIRQTIEELRENYISLEKRLDNMEGPGKSDSKNQDKNGLDRDYSRGGLSKKEDPGKNVRESKKETYWIPLDIKYDCSGESHKVAEGLEDLSRLDIKSLNNYNQNIKLDESYTSPIHPSQYGKEDLNSNYRRFSRENTYGEIKDLAKREFSVDSAYSNESWEGSNHRYIKISPVEDSE